MSSQTSRKQQTPEVTSIKEMRGHTNNVEGIVHLPGGRRIVTCSWDGSLRLWDLESGAQIGEDWRDNEEKGAGVYCIALSPNGKTIASGSEDRKVKLWDVETGQVIQKWTGHTKAVRSVCWSAGGDRVVSGSWDWTARVWNARTGETILEIKTGHKTVYTVEYSPDDTQIATGGYNEHAAKIWDAKTGELIKTLKHDYIVFSLAWTSDGKKLITASRGPIRIFDTATWEQIATLEGHTNSVDAISLSHNNRLLASASDGSTARIWNLDTNLPVEPSLQYKGAVYSTAFSANGRVLVTRCSDKNAYVWDIHAILKQAGLEDLLQPPSDVPKSLKGIDATRLPPIQARRIPPGFFDGVQNSSQSSTTHTRSSAYHPRRALAPSSADLQALLNRISSFFHHSRSDTDAATELQQRSTRSIFSRGPRVVEVAAVQDRKPLAVAPQRRTHATGTTAPGATSAPIPWWAHVVLFLCCASPRQATQSQQQQQSQAHGQVHTQGSSSQPAAPSTSMAPASAIGSTPPTAATVQSQRLPLRARVVLFLCCASPAHADADRMFAEFTPGRANAMSPFNDDQRASQGKPEIEHTPRSSVSSLSDKSFLEADATRGHDEFGSSQTGGAAAYLPPFPSTLIARSSIALATKMLKFPSSNALRIASTLALCLPVLPSTPSRLHIHALLARLSSLLPHSQLNTEETEPHTVTPSRSDALMVVLSSRVRSQPHANGEIEFSQCATCLHVIEVAPMRDREVLYVADPAQADRLHRQSVGPPHSRPIRLLGHIGLFPAVAQSTQQQQGQSQGPYRPKSLQATPAAHSTSTTPTVVFMLLCQLRQPHSHGPFHRALVLLFFSAVPLARMHQIGVNTVAHVNLSHLVI
ncbi:WD40-repeat-containing domain protein [Suillus occidentalis]|nr:WD40-repeat-containing domain protein [Suillus occidentalis]